MFHLALLPLSAALLAPPPRDPGRSGDLLALTDGVQEVVAPGCIPGPMVVFGKSAFVVLTARSGKQRAPLFAAVRIGRARALAGGHEGFFSEQALADSNNSRFLKNAVTWLGHKRISNLHVGMLGMSGMAPTLLAEGTTVVQLARADVPDKLAGLDVLCLGQGALDGDKDRQQAVQSFLQKGGGLLIAGPAWGWTWGAGDKLLAVDHTGNALLRRYGIAFADGMVDGPYDAKGAEDPLFNTDIALESLKTGSSPVALQTVERMLTVLPPYERAYTQRIEMLAAAGSADAVPTLKTPVTDQQPLARLKAVLDARTWRTTAVDKVTAHPAAADFPGAVPADAPRIGKKVSVDTRMPAWHSTGLYAAPGEPVTVRLPESAVGAGLRVRIGCHSDALWGLSKWQRFPEITMERPLKAAWSRFASPFGGTIFVVVPEGCKAGWVDVRIDGAVAQPRFVRGQTTPAQWRALRAAPAPWAELEGKLVCLSVPSTSVRDLDDPSALMAYWDEVMENCYTLFAAPKRPRPERYCVDRQISAGYMHSGYPIMTWEDVAKTFCDVAKLRSKGGPIWGFYHEMGHNFQERDWTFEGTGEVTNNLFSVYGAEKLNQVTPDDFGLAHPALKPDAAQKRLVAYLADGAKFSKWQSDPFLALSMYLQVRKAFGWEPFTKVFAEYRALPADQRPKTDGEKRDQWMVRMSRAVGKNLGPFFQAWGVPTSDAARGSLVDLPTWMPPDWPK